MLTLFKGLEYTEKIGESPAAVNLRTGVLYINPKVFFQYPTVWRKFILLHEAGHLVLQTYDEHAADEYAFHYFQKDGDSLKDAVLSLAKVLDESNDAHAKRIRNILDKAKWFDENVYLKKFVEPHKRKLAMSDYISVQSTELASCMGCNNMEGAKQAMVKILLVIEPEKELVTLEKFAKDLADLKLGNYDGKDRDSTAYFFCFGNKACQERQKLKSEMKAELIKCKEACKKNVANYQGEQVVETAGSIAGGVANAIIPGSGPLVQKIVSGGGKVINAIVGIFKKKKAEGKTDAQAYNDPEFLAAKEAAAKELEQMYEDSAIYQEKFAKYLGQFTEDDKIFSTMRKKAKMKREVLPEAGTKNGDTFSYGGLSLKLSGLNVFKPVFGLGAGVDAPVYGAPASNSGTATQAPKSETGLADPNASGDESTTEDKKKKRTRNIIIAVSALGVLLVVVGIIYFARKAKKAKE